MQRQREIERIARLHEQHRAGLVVAAVYNLREVVLAFAGSRHKTRSWTPHDFFPELPAPEAEVPGKMTTEAMLEMVVVLNQALGGRDLRGERA